jgi:DNA-directed RNA polymerase subunit beta
MPRSLSRARKDKNSKKEKIALEKLDKEHAKNTEAIKEVLIEKLMKLLKEKQSNSITNVYKEVAIAKGTKFSIKMLSDINFQEVDPGNWTKDEDTNEQVKVLLHNYTIKHNEEVGRYKKREVQHFHWR